MENYPGFHTQILNQKKEKNRIAERSKKALKRNLVIAALAALVPITAVFGPEIIEVIGQNLDKAYENEANKLHKFQQENKLGFEENLGEEGKLDGLYPVDPEDINWDELDNFTIDEEERTR